MKNLLFRIGLFALTLSAGLLTAQVPQLISYQGRVGVDGVNFDGSGQFKFAFVNAAGTDTYWSNDGSSNAGSEPGTAITIPVSKGLYAVLLGDATLAHMSIVPATVFTNGDVHLRVWFSDGVNGFQQLTPDRRIAAVGYAMMADSVSDGAITTAKIADGAVTSAKLAAGVVQTANLATGAVGNAQLANSGLTINAGTGLGGGGLVSLGGAVSLSNAGVLSLTGGGGITVDAGTGAITLGSSATSAGTAGAIVARDANGGFTAGTITAALNGNAATATTATDFTGMLAGDVTGTQSATAIADATVTGKLLTSFTSAAGTIAATDSILSAISKLDGNTALKAPLASPTFTGSVTLPGGSATAAPLLLQTGTSLTTPTFGALEFDGTNLFVTNNSASPTRKTVAFTDSTVTTAQIEAGSVTTAKLATGAVGSAQLASGLTLGGTTTGTFSGSLTGNVTGNVSGSAASFTGSLAGEVTGTQAATVVSTVGGLSAANIAAGATQANSATSANTASALVTRDASGNFSAGIITGTLNGNAATATTAGSATNFTGALAGDVTGSQSATVIADATVTGKLLTSFTSAAGTIAATDSILSAISKLDGNTALKAPLASPTFTGSVTLPAGSATAAPLLLQTGTSLTTPTLGAIEFDGTNVFVTNNSVSPTRKTVAFTDSTVTTAQIEAGSVTTAKLATGAVGSSQLASGLTLGGTTTGTFSGNLTGNVTGNVSGSAASFTGSLAGDVTGTQAATVVSTVGGVTSTSLAAGATLANAATHADTASTLVRRDASGNFSAGTITAALNGNASTATSAPSFTGMLTGDVTGTQGATVISTVSGISAANIAAGATLANTATSANTASALVTRDASGNFSAGIITGTLIGNAATATTAGSATSFTGGLTGDVTGTQSATLVSRLGGLSAASIASGAELANNATAANAAGTLVKRDASGNFSAGTITGSLDGNAATATNATSFTGMLAGDVTGTQGATVIADGSVTAAKLAAGAVGSTQLAPGAAAANLSASNQSGVPSGGTVLSITETNAALQDAGYQATGARIKVGATASHDVWRERSSSSARAYHTTVWTGSEMIVWGGGDGNPGGEVITNNNGGRHTPATNSWTPTSQINAPNSRAFHTAVWTGSEMIVWGGFSGVNRLPLNSGGRYNPSTNSWRPTSLLNAPTARYGHSTIWTGSEMIVWGGLEGIGGNTGYANTGARYNPTTDKWTIMTTINSPIKRIDHEAIWTGSEMIVWGGHGNEDPTQPYFKTGARYNPSTNVWSTMSNIDAPYERTDFTSIWTGTEMIVWGGLGYSFDEGTLNLNTGGLYNPITDSWRAIPTRNAPERRYGHAAVWTGYEMIVWGGHYQDDSGYFDYTNSNSGGSYDPASKTWSNINSIDAPAGKVSPSAVWTGSEILFFGGYVYSLLGDKTTSVNDCYSYTPGLILHLYQRP